MGGIPTHLSKTCASFYFHIAEAQPHLVFHGNLNCKCPLNGKKWEGEIQLPVLQF